MCDEDKKAISNSLMNPSITLAIYGKSREIGQYNLAVYKHRIYTKNNSAGRKWIKISLLLRRNALFTKIALRNSQYEDF